MKKTTMQETITYGQEWKDAVKKPAKILLEFDRLPGNLDSVLLEKKLADQLLEYGRVEVCLFACPSYKPLALLTERPEEYIETQVKTPDLFIPRVPRLLELKKKFVTTGIPLIFTIIVGDNDPQKYVLPILAKYGISINEEKMSIRQRLYKESFQKRAIRSLGKGIDIVTLSELAASDVQEDPAIDSEILEKEEEFLKRLFSKNGPYMGNFNLTSKDIKAMAEMKIINYARQGVLLQDLTSGILLQTETPWLQRTRMLKLGGAKVAVIYPWIRREEMDST